MKSIHLLALLLLLPAALWGCSESMLASDAAAPEFGIETHGEALLFVGTDPTTLSTDLYLVRAASLQSENPSIATADSYELERLTDTAGEQGGELLVAGDRLFSEDMPHPVPDRDGNRVALLVTDTSEPDDEAMGRVAIIDLVTRETTVSADIPGLHGARFTDEGEWLVLDQYISEGRRLLLLLPADDLEADLIGVDVAESEYTHEFAGLIADSNDFLVLAVHEGIGASRVYRVTAETGISTLLSEQLDGLLHEPTLSPDGSLLAVTLNQTDADKRSIVVISADGAATPVTDALDADCYWPAWSPTATAKQGYKLTFVCQNITSNRPDIGLWWSNTPDPDAPPNGCCGEGTGTDADAGADLITNVSQPAIFEGTMDDLVIRSRPQWDPLGESLVFGVSTVAEADAGEGMTLLVLPIGGTAYSVYSGSGTSVDWAHFSAAASEPSLLLWERSATGLEDTDSSAANAQPIRVVDIGQPDPEPTDVRLGLDLLVSYPMFLGHNSLFYP